MRKVILAERKKGFFYAQWRPIVFESDNTIVVTKST